MKNLVDYIVKKSSDCLLDPYVIAEAGVNHEGDYRLAVRLIEEAADGGADAIKFQTYKADKIASKHSPSYWDLKSEPTTSQYQLFKKYDNFNEEDYNKLADVCQQNKIKFLSTAFDVDSANFLNPIMSAFKISSSDLNNLPFIEYLCKFKKPIILSTGASTETEIQDAVDLIQRHGVPIAILHCVLNYPTRDENANLGRILTLRETFPNLVVGYSDHTLPGSMKILELSAMLGAQIIEKHFTHNKALPGNDHYHAMDMQDLKLFRENMKFVRQVMGNGEMQFTQAEIKSRENARRSLIYDKSMKMGDVIKSEDLTWKRPGTGINPSQIGDVIGRRLCKNVEYDQLVSFSDFGSYDQ